MNSSYFNSSNRDQFLEEAKAARVQRQRDKQDVASVVKIQALIRGFLVRRKIKKNILDEFDGIFVDDIDCSKIVVSGHEVFHLLRRFFAFVNIDKERSRFDKACRYILTTLLTPSLPPKMTYIAAASDPNLTMLWIQQHRFILHSCASFLKQMRPEVAADHKPLMLYLNAFLSLTDPNIWKVAIPAAAKAALSLACTKALRSLVDQGLYESLQSVLKKGLCRSRPCLNKTELTAIISISLRPLNFPKNEAMLSLFLIHIMSVPGLVFHLSQSSPDSITVISTGLDIQKVCIFLETEENLKSIFMILDGNYGLCLLANLIHWISIDLVQLNKFLVPIVKMIRGLLQKCQEYVVTKKSSSSHWHQILGWFSQKEDPLLHESLPYVRKQLSQLWDPQVTKTFFQPLLDFNEKSAVAKPSEPKTPSPETETPPFSMSILRKVIDKASLVMSNSSSISISGNPDSLKHINNPEVHMISLIVSMYTTALQTLTQLRMEALAGLCYTDLVVQNLWTLFRNLDNRNGLITFLEVVACQRLNYQQDILQVLILFCECTSHLITILDDVELYEKQTPLNLEQLVSVSTFVNEFVFRLIWHNLVDLNHLSSNAIFQATHTLLMVLYRRDSRRPYTPPDHWLIRDIKINSFLRDLEAGKKTSHLLMMKTPHIIPHKYRVMLFRKNVSREKDLLGFADDGSTPGQSTLIAVHRLRIVEDGYQQLALLPPAALKGFVRVKFINAQGLDEAGIDQDGVFKEFLEETLKRVFDPSLNLFRSSSEGRLYPSPTSYIHDNHLSLFEFVGKVLGKAVYEGIVVDVPFASFFLTQVLGHQQHQPSHLHSSIDELPSLDPELYKNLTFVKHYEGDISDLGLTFCVEEDFMGRIISHDLIPGGKTMAVTRGNRIHYIHLMAHFRMHTQIKEQTSAFVRGFRSIVNPEWLSMFSAPEVQRLISGDNNPIDISDLRRHTKYYGGFHSSHRVIIWLWDVLEKDFSPEEHRLFLKFVTSCSKPPLLGFAHLEPSFSVRCVEVSDDQDHGDTVGSVLRGFFTIRRKDPISRLPTSSTCFNLLKLPNYQKKTTLRDKLRYAIRSNTGFELS